MKINVKNIVYCMAAGLFVVYLFNVVYDFMIEENSITSFDFIICGSSLERIQPFMDWDKMEYHCEELFETGETYIEKAYGGKGALLLHKSLGETISIQREIP